MIIFRNPGLIDINAAIIMGINAKTNESPIGFFGTGLKYSIATILRNGCQIEIYRGHERYKFTTEEIITRDQKFDVVVMNDRQLGFTTDLGRRWELWQAYRELYSNMKDEGGEVFKDKHLLPLTYEGETRIVVYGSAFEEIYENRGTFILENDPLYITEVGDLHAGHTRGLFYRGIKVEHSPLPYANTFNVKRYLELTEDRTVKWEWQKKNILAEIVDALVQQGHIILAESIICEKNFAEQEIDYDGLLHGDQRSEAFLDLMAKLVKTRLTDVNESALRAYERLRKPQLEMMEQLELSPIQRKRLAKALMFAFKMGFQVDAYPIIFVKQIGDNTMGLAYKGKIYVSAAAFEKGTKELVATLIEEFIHLHYHHLDCTRSLQNFLFDRMISFAEELHGEPL